MLKNSAYLAEEKWEVNAFNAFLLLGLFVVLVKGKYFPLLQHLSVPGMHWHCLLLTQKKSHLQSLL